MLPHVPTIRPNKRTRNAERERERGDGGVKRGRLELRECKKDYDTRLWELGGEGTLFKAFTSLTEGAILRRFRRFHPRRRRCQVSMPLMAFRKAFNAFNYFHLFSFGSTSKSTRSTSPVPPSPSSPAPRPSTAIRRLSECRAGGQTV